ncbi:MAG: head GIN domain-containing protein [Kineosporiaceae bacterium]
MPAVVLAVVVVSACGAVGSVQGSGVVKSEEREVEGFAGIRLTGIGDVRVRQTGTESVTVSAEDNILPLLDTDVRSGVLEIGLRDDAGVRTTEPVRIAVTVDSLDLVETTGSGTIVVEGLEAEDLAAVSSGSGDVGVEDLTADDVTATTTGSGDITLAGSAARQSAQSSGSGDVLACDLDSDEAEVDTSGSGDVELSVSERLTMTVSGSGSVRYVGEPDVSEDTTGSGDVERLESCPG